MAPLMMSIVTPNPGFLPASMSALVGFHSPTSTSCMDGMVPDGVVQNQKEVLNAITGSSATRFGSAKIFAPTAALAGP